MKKKCAVIYSGGKDGHLALASALKSGYSVSCLLNIDGGKNHHKYFSELGKPGMLAMHSSLLGIPLLRWAPPQSLLRSRNIGKTVGGLLETARRKYDFDSVFCGSLEEDESGNASDFRSCGSSLGMRIFTPCAGHDIFLAARETFRLGMRTLIVGASREAGLEWVGRLLDKAFLGHLKTLLAAGGRLNANDIQTTVIASPLFSGFVEVTGMRFVPGGLGGFLKVSGRVRPGRYPEGLELPPRTGGKKSKCL